MPVEHPLRLHYNSCRTGIYHEAGINGLAGVGMSSFTWLDYSEHERKQAMEVIELFREEETRDELGLGTIRDALADLLFPGTSTVQTRLRYFLFVPWLLRDLEGRKVPSDRAPEHSRRLQTRLCEALKEEEDQIGIIGRRAGRHVQRLPSSIYWHGLQRWGVRLFPGSEEDYYRHLDRFHQRQRQAVRGEHGEHPEGRPPAPWHSSLPLPPKGFPQEASLALTEEEAHYLIDRIRHQAPGSLLQAFMDCDLEADLDQTRFPWEHPLADELSEPLAGQLEHVRCFSEVMHGAALLYNLMLAEQADWRAGTKAYRDHLQLWWDTLAARGPKLRAWSRPAFWQLLAQEGARVTPMARAFVNAWLEAVLHAQGLKAVTGSQDLRRLIHHRERQLKRGRARLDNPRMRETWNGASGTAPLDFRWNRPVRSYLQDLQTALSKGVVHA